MILLFMGYQEEKEADWFVYLSQTYALSQDKIERLWDEFLSHTAITVEDYIVQRHLQLKAQGLTNERIYLLLIEEVAKQRFKVPEYSIRKIRRIIYG